MQRNIVNNMVIQKDILNYADSRSSFTPKELLSYFESQGRDFSKRTVETQLFRLVKNNTLVKLKRGVYCLSDAYRERFIPYFDDEMARVEEIVKSTYPLLNICVWNIRDIKNLSHYVTKHDIIYVELDRDAMEGAFVRLEEEIEGRRVFLNPTLQEYSYYISGRPSIVVRPLVTEAPLIAVNHYLSTSVEKILVDVVSDHDFDFWHDYEALRLYDTALSRYDINFSKLQRYARRRGKLKK